MQKGCQQVFMSVPDFYLIQPFVYSFFQAVQSMMSEQPRRTLRKPGKPKYLNSDDDDNELYGCGRHYYANEIKSPAVQLNATAKLLVKYINKTNKNLRESRNPKPKESLENESKEPAIKDKKNTKANNADDTSKRPNHYDREKPHDAIRKTKDPKDPKTQTKGSDSQKHPNPQSKNRGISNETLNNLLMGHHSLALHLSQMQNKPQELRNLPPQILSQLAGSPNFLYEYPFNQNQSPFSSKQKQNIPNIASNPNNANNPSIGNEVQAEKQMGNFGEQKLFKRSSYHVAIAYHIYLKKLKETSGSQADLDPTSNARKLREGKPPQEREDMK